MAYRCEVGPSHEVAFVPLDAEHGGHP
jgi:hypothetical protein